jgi:hypothetical protein
MSSETLWNEAINGISFARAVELEGSDYPRLATAIFRFEELTPQEQVNTIEALRRELADAKTRAKRIGKEVAEGYAKIRKEQAQGKFYGGQDSMIKPYLHAKRKEANRDVKRLEVRLADLEQRKKTLKPDLAFEIAKG